MTGYTLRTSSYRAAKNEWLYDRKRTVPEVHLLFLIKKGSNVNAKKVREYYLAPNIPYYTVPGQYKEADYQINAMELRMEFYLELVQDFCMPGEGVYGVFTGTKFMIACRVRVLLVDVSETILSSKVQKCSQ